MPPRSFPAAEAVTLLVSPEMATVIGRGPADPRLVPADAALLLFGLGEFGTPATLRIAPDAAAERAGPWVEGGRSLSCIVAREALARLFGWSPESGTSHFHLTTELRAIAQRLIDCPLPEPSLTAYRIGKSIELLCEAMRLIGEGRLVPVAGGGLLTPSDSERLVAARRMIDEHWSEKLTLDGLARACGLNRAKLTRGFRELFHCTVAEAIAERRLTEARRQLLTTDLPVSSIGYASGYHNNASFSRAFGRRFGVSPRAYRLSCAAA